MLKNDIKYRFLRELSRHLDVAEAIEYLKISRLDAKSIIDEASALFRAADASKNGRRGFISLYVDGASRGNPGRAGIGISIKNEHGEVIKNVKRYLGITTNNAAEYKALIIALENVSEMGCKRIKIFSDSELLVRHIKGEYNVRSSALKPLYIRVCELLSRFDKYDIIHIERAMNKEADRLANLAIDES